MGSLASKASPPRLLPSRSERILRIRLAAAICRVGRFRLLLSRRGSIAFSLLGLRFNFGHVKSSVVRVNVVEVLVVRRSQLIGQIDVRGGHF